MPLKHLQTFPKVVKGSLELLLPSDRTKLYILVSIQLLLSILDLIGIFAIGVVGSLAVNLDTTFNGNRLQEFILQVFSLEYLARNDQIIFFGGFAVVTLLLRTITSLFLTRYTLQFLAQKSADLSDRVIHKYVNSTLEYIQRTTEQETAYNLTIGVDRATIGILGTVVGLLTDLGLVIVLFIGLAITDFYLSVQVVIYFMIVAFWISRWGTKRASVASRRLTEVSIATSEKIVEFIKNYRELYANSRRKIYADKISHLRKKSVDFTSSLGFIPYLGKSIIETSLVVGAVGLTASQMVFKDFNEAASTLAIFLAASTRISPSIIRIQQGVIQLQAHSAAIEGTFRIINDLNMSEAQSFSEKQVVRKSFSPGIVISDVNFIYSGSKTQSLENINLTIPKGSTVAIVGPSGSGKSTLIDLMLGINSPTSGSVLVSGLTPKQSIEAFPGSISYVSQHSSIIKGTVRENFYDENSNELISKKMMNSLLSITHLTSFIQNLPLGLDTQLQELGKDLSGGQRQRIILLRALLSLPSLLILDEATSAIDLATEKKILAGIQSLLHKSTIIFVTHRIETAKSADLVVYMRDGRIIRQGTYAQVIQAVKYAEMKSIPTKRRRNK